MAGIASPPISRSTNGSAPTWSSCPCVSTIASMSSRARAGRRSPAARGRCRAGRASGTSGPCRRPRCGPRTRRPSCSCRSPPARRAGARAGGRSNRAQEAVSLERVADHGGLLLGGLDHRQPEARPRRGRACSSRVFTGIGLIVAEHGLEQRRSSSSSISERASGSSIIRRISRPTRCEATQMPPVPPVSSTSASMSSLPASRSMPSIGSMSS